MRVNIKDKKVVKVNLGSGSRGIEGWINIDVGLKFTIYKFLPILSMLQKIGLASQGTINWIRESGKPPPNWVKHDIRKRLPFPNNSVDFVYMSEVIEHFYYYESIEILKDIYRILKPSGILRITTPDIRKISSALLNNEIDAYHFNLFFYVEQNYHKPTFLERLAIKLYNTRYHCWLYDFESLKKMLKEAGFINIVELEPKKGRTPDIDILENYDKKTYDTFMRYSMFVEAEKP
ncbi:methyltransferase domain-containing protein [Sulfurisphaera ohwakuensis]|uniref:methyltransferase domain-containing protein n=1 Tax=Sulfurisphaera ohwakuensis TaxID=69656 RepID=UPI0036F37BF5